MTSSCYYGCKFSIRTNGRAGSQILNAAPETRHGGTVVYRHMRKLLLTLALMAFTFVDALKLKRKLAHSFVGIVQPTFKIDHILLQFPKFTLKKQRLPDKFKQLLEHGE